MSVRIVNVSTTSYQTYFYSHNYVYIFIILYNKRYTHVEDMLRGSIFITDKLSLDDESLVFMVTVF